MDFSQKKIITPYAEVTLVQEGIVIQKWHKLKVDNMVLLDKHLCLLEDFLEGIPHAFLADIRNAGGISKEARDVMGSERVAKICKASGMLVSSNLSRILATFFVRFYKTPFPIKIFSDQDKALAWLAEQ